MKMGDGEMVANYLKKYFNIMDMSVSTETDNKNYKIRQFF